MLRCTTRWIFAAAVGFALISTAQAQSRLEELLRNPWMQQILGNRIPEVNTNLIRTDAQLCATPAFRAANVQRCLAADQATRIASIPAELRLLLTTPAGAAALRELCINAPSTIPSTNYLCVELAKGDTSLGQAIGQQQLRSSIESIHGDQRP